MLKSNEHTLYYRLYIVRDTCIYHLPTNTHRNTAQASAYAVEYRNIIGEYYLWRIIFHQCALKQLPLHCKCSGLFKCLCVLLFAWMFDNVVVLFNDMPNVPTTRTNTSNSATEQACFTFTEFTAQSQSLCILKTKTY